MSESAKPDPAGPCAVVIFGAAGDLTKRLLLPALYNLAEGGLLPKKFALIGFARTDVSEDELRDRFREWIAEAEEGDVDDKVLDRVLGHFTYVKASFDDEEGWDELAKVLEQARKDAGTGGNVLFYMATGPDWFQTIAGELARRDLLAQSDEAWRRVIFEKPFGEDLGSAKTLNEALLEAMDESQIYRIDHFLGKETVQNILVFRFGNGIFEPIWNRRYIDHVQITVAETLGVEGRGGYYDESGALRDMVPNHLFQILTFTAMEPPASLAAGALHHEQAKVLESIVPLRAKDCGLTTVRGQYAAGKIDGKKVPGYREEPKVNKKSTTETFAAFKLQIDNWRWAGVPFYLRTGKRLAKKKTEVVIHFKDAPLTLFRHAGAPAPAANELVMAIQPEEAVILRLAAKVPGPAITASRVDMRFGYAEHFGHEKQTGYETLLYDAMVGDRSLFKRDDMVEAGWTIVDPILKAWEKDACRLAEYAAGSEGPKEADGLIEADGRRWRKLA